MTLRMYASRKGWGLREVEVELDIARVYAEDCTHCEEPRAMVDRIRRRITFVGDLDAGQWVPGRDREEVPGAQSLAAGLRIEDEIV